MFSASMGLAVVEKLAAEIRTPDGTLRTADFASLDEINAKAETFRSLLDSCESFVPGMAARFDSDPDLESIHIPVRLKALSDHIDILRNRLLLDLHP